MVTTASEWREKRKQGVEVTLPEYGDVVTIRPMDVEFWFRSGRIPDYLLATVQQMINNDRVDKIPTPESLDKTREWLDWLDDLMVWTFVNPKVTKGTPQDGEISVEEIAYPDKLFIYSLFGRPASVLRRFRDYKVKPVASVDAAKNNGPATEQSNGRAALVEPLAGNAGQDNRPQL